MSFVLGAGHVEIGATNVNVWRARDDHLEDDVCEPDELWEDIST